MWRLWVLFFVCVGAVRALSVSTGTYSFGERNDFSVSLTANDPVQSPDYSTHYAIYYSVNYGGNAYGLGGVSYIVWTLADGTQKVFYITSSASSVSGYVNIPKTASRWCIATYGDYYGTEIPGTYHRSDWQSLKGKQVVSPNSPGQEFVVGNAVVARASGSQGGSYNISVVEGDGVVSIDSVAGDWVVTANAPGVFKVRWWISACFGFDRSADVDLVFTAKPKPKQVTISLPANNSSSPVNYNVMQDGQSLGTITQMPGAGARIGQYSVNGGGGPVTLVATTGGVVQDGVTLVETADGSGSVQKVNNLVANPSNVKDGEQFVIDDKGKITESSTGKVVDQTTPTVPPKDNTTPVIWSAGGGSQTDLVTNTVYREGTGKVIKAIEDQTTKILGPDAEKLPDAIAPQFEEVKAHPTSSDMVDAIEGLLPAAPQFPTSVGRSAELDMDFGDMGGVFPRPLSFKLGVPASARTAAGWLRDIELYGLYVVFFLICLRLIRKTFA
jgi:hypothetical protein